MFGKKDNQVNDRIIYQAKPNMIFGCKKAIFGLILLLFVLFVSGPMIQFIGRMQVYMISYVKLSLTRYTAIGVFVIILLIVIYIIWQIVGWYSKEYLLTESRIVVKSGVFVTRKNFMPYSTIQDINTSQGFVSKLFNVGSVSVYSAYDNNQISIENISNPSEVEDMIFSKITQPRAYYQPHNDNYNNYRGNSESYRPYPNHDDYYEHYDYQSPHQNIDNTYHSRDYYEDDDYVITPIRQEEQRTRREYDYYPEDINYQNPQRNRYEYEPYEESLEHNINRAMNSNYEPANDNQGRGYYEPANDNQGRGYYEPANDNQGRGYYDEVSSNYSHSDEDYYNDYDDYSSYDESLRKDDNSQKQNIDDSRESVIQRHFDKFKR